MQTPQHQPSNALQGTGAKYTTDDYLVGDLQLRNNLVDIEYKKNMYEYLEVSDVDIAYVRGNFDNVNDHSYNEITRGDALALILLNHYKEYEGLVNQDGDDEPLENDAEESLQVASEIDTVKRKKIFDSMYDTVNGTTVYFLK